jgi:hypothetical protein
VEGIVKKFVPPRRLRNNRPQWIMQAILREIRRKRRLWKSLKGGGSLAEYKEQGKKSEKHDSEHQEEF